MTPHVIYDETNLIEASDELKARVKLLRKMVAAISSGVVSAVGSPSPLDYCHSPFDLKFAPFAELA